MGTAALLVALMPVLRQPQTVSDVWSVDIMPAERHPCLFFTADELPRIRERLQRPPYATWWANVQRSENMVDQAFTWRMTGNVAKAEAVRRRLLQCNPTGYHCCCGVADALQGVAEAYDLLHGYEGLSETDHRVIRAKIAHACERLYLSALESGPGQHPGNQRTRGVCALGTAAIVLADYQEAAHTPKQWLQRALDGVHDQANLAFWREDGMFIEGPGYSSFTLSIMLPFARYYHKATGKWLFDDPRLRNALLYLLYITQPDGDCAAIGTTNMLNVVNSLKLCVGAGDPQDQARFRWALDEWGSLASGGVRELSLFDDSVRSSIGGLSTNRYFTTSQEAALRNEWSRNAVALWFKGKDPWLAATHPVYSHGDVGSFVLHAYGELLAVDAGYDHWISRDLYPAELHNTLLVDGEGPTSETSGVLTNLVATDFVASGTVETQYAGIQLQRTFVVVDGRYVAILDDIQAQKEHNYAWLIHTPVSRATGRIEVKGSRASWTGFDPRSNTVGEVALEACWTGPVEVQAFETSRWQPWDADPKTGSYDNWALVARQRGTNVRYMVVLYPHPKDQPAPLVRDITTPSGLGLQLDLEPRRRDLVFTGDYGEEGALWRGSARLAIVTEFDRSPNWVYVLGPGEATYGGTPALALSAGGAAAVRLNGIDRPPRVYLAGSAGLTVNLTLNNIEADAMYTTSGERLAPLVWNRQQQCYEFVLPAALPGPACVVAGTLAQDTEAPRVVEVQIDDHLVKREEAVNLGRVAIPPKLLRVVFEDRDSGLDCDLGACVTIDGQRTRSDYPLTKHGEGAEVVVDLDLPEVTEPRQHEVIISVFDDARNRTQCNLRFSLAPLLINGGFESQGAWSFGAWSRNEETQYEIDVVTNYPHSGDRCLMMRGVAGALNMVASQHVELKRGQTYVLKGFYRGDVPAKVSLCNQAGTGQYIWSPSIGPSEEWMNFEWEFTVENPDVSLIIALRLSQIGSAYFDDLELVEKP
ncbi:MAG: heparinase II/III domain-containing protein [Candidatus Zipacnadales bacterium]